MPAKPSYDSKSLKRAYNCHVKITSTPRDFYNEVSRHYGTPRPSIQQLLSYGRHHFTDYEQLCRQLHDDDDMAISLLREKANNILLAASWWPYRQRM
jgi:hypothetical protein